MIDGRKTLRWIRREWLLAVMLALLPVMVLMARPDPARVAALVDWKTIGALCGLMILSRGLELGGVLERAGRALVTRVGSLRALAVALVIFAAVLAAVVTNDVALFITVPLTMALRTQVVLPVGRLVIFQALAVNAGSAISPIGNPQNLFLWQVSGAGFAGFALAMAPLALAMMVVVLLAVPIAFGRQPLRAQRAVPRGLALQKRLVWVSLCLYPPFLVLVNLGHAVPAALGVFALFVVFWRVVLRGVDWLLLVVFALMFINLGLLADLGPVQAAVVMALDATGGIYLLGAGVSQLMSNVPAAIFLERFTADWQPLAWGVNVGGFGVVIGSLANLIALRLAGGGLMGEFHRWSVPVFMASLAIGAVLLWLLP